MKRLGYLLASLLLVTATVRATDITANELAQHLGVSVWRIPHAKLPKKITVSIREVRDGKLADGGSSAAFTLDGTTDLVVCSHEQDGKMIVTFACGGAVVYPEITGMNTAPFATKSAINGPAIGTHLIFADYPIIKDARNPLGREIDTDKIEDVKRGIAFVVQ
jgi:hypothetical protein